MEDGTDLNDFSSIYPTNINEFPGLNCCSSSCWAFCNGPSENDCTSCFSSELDEYCQCPYGIAELHARQYTSGCSKCGYSCDQCDEEIGECSSCYSKNSTLINNTCVCDEGYYMWYGTCYFACGEDCYECIEGEKEFCLWCNDAHATADANGICWCNDGFPQLSNETEALQCQGCLGDCYLCEGNPYYCTYCYDYDSQPIDGVCTCNRGFYPSTYDWEGESYLWCKYCDDTCDKCDPDCFQCSDDSLPSGDQCFDTSLPYKMKFRNGVINILFANDLNFIVQKHDLSIRSQDGYDYDVTYWELEQVSLREYNLYSDLTANQLPVEVDFTFAKQPF